MSSSASNAADATALGSPPVRKKPSPTYLVARTGRSSVAACPAAKSASTISTAAARRLRLRLDDPPDGADVGLRDRRRQIGVDPRRAGALEDRPELALDVLVVVGPRPEMSLEDVVQAAGRHAAILTVTPRRARA